ncbi:hypothetical protein YC2023_041906 [Brassica napus]
MAFCNTSSGTSWPRLVIIAPSSLEEILPSPFTSNFLNTASSSLISVLPERALCRKGESAPVLDAEPLD